MWVEQGSEFNKRSRKSYLKNNDIVHCSQYNKMKSKDINRATCVKYASGVNKKKTKFKPGDYLRMSKYRNIFAEGNVPNWNEKQESRSICIKQDVKNTVPQMSY